MNIKEILISEKGRTAQAQKIFAAKAAEMQITAFTKDECKILRKWFKSEVVNFDAFFATKPGNDALCHGLKNLVKGMQAKGVKDGAQGQQEQEQDGAQGQQEQEQDGAQGQQEQEQDGAQGQQEQEQDGAQGQQEQEQDGAQGQQEQEQDGAQGQQEQEQDGAQGQQEQEQDGAQGQQEQEQDGAQGQQEQEQDGAQGQQEQEQDGAQGQQEQEQDGAQGQQEQEQDGAQGQQEQEQDGAQGQQEQEQDGAQGQQEQEAPVTYEDLTDAEKEAYCLMQKGKIPYLWGPAGTGKTTAAERIAKASGQKFYFTSSVFDKYDLTGFVDAQGELIDTPLIKAIINGGDYLFDEWDVSDNQSVKFFNMLLSQRMFVIPKYGVVKCHPKFRVIAAGNTKGTGPTANYPTAVIQDASCRNRFVSIYYGYNEEIETKLAKGDKALVSFVHDLRAAVKESGLDTVISYRNIINCKDMQEMDFYKGKDALVVKRCFAGDFDEDNFEMVSANLTTNNKYTRLFKGLEIENI